jgi:colanic acid/amylovoran biosynthesis glycosyltransferase
MSAHSPVVAYLAPALTALESTFVYDELFALEQRGVRVVPVSVHRPVRYLTGHDELLASTHYLYEGGAASTVRRSMAALAGNRKLRFREAFGLLKTDLWSVGLWHGRKLAYQFLVAAQLADVLIKRGCQHLHIHFAHVPTQIGMYAAAMAGIPFTVMAHANDIFERALLLPTKAQRSKKFLTISDFNRAYLERCGLPADKLAVVRCGVQVPDVEKPPTGSPKHRFLIGSLGRLVEKKGFDVLIEAAGVLKQRGHALELLIAGDGPLRDELMALVEQRQLAQCVTFVGPLSHSAVPAWMATLDAFVLACKPDANGDMDGIPVVLMEAMAQGLPVVSSRLSGIPELVAHQRTGLLAEPGDAQGTATQIERLMASPEYARTLARQGQAHVRNEFGQAVNIDRLLSHMNVSV